MGQSLDMMGNRKTLCAIRETSNDAIKTKDTRRYTISEKNGRRRNSNLNLDKDTTQFLKRRSISKGAGEKLMENRRKSRAGSVFSLSKPDGSSDGRRQSNAGGRRISLVPTEFGFMSERRASQIRGTTRLQSDGKSFSGLPLTYYIPEEELNEFNVFENSYQMLPKSIFNTAMAEEKVVEVVDAFASKYYIRSDAVQGVQLMCDEVRDALKQLQYSRYRFVVSGYIAEKDAQDVVTPTMSEKNGKNFINYGVQFASNGNAP